MTGFLQEKIEGEKFELLIDTKIFPKEIILKSAYNFLNRWYFFFQFNAEQNIILEFTKRWDSQEDPRNVIADFSDTMLDTLLRDNLEKENKVIREAIVEKAINGPLDTDNFVTLDTDNNSIVQNEIDLDQDIDDILKEIENDPDLKINEWEIENILKEIEEEKHNPNPMPTITPDLSAVANMKEQFKNK